MSGIIICLDLFKCHCVVGIIKLKNHIKNLYLEGGEEKRGMQPFIDFQEPG